MGETTSDYFVHTYNPYFVVAWGAALLAITLRRRELFYWAAILATFALGTAAGDMTAVTFRLGFLASGILFAVVFAIPGVAYWLLGLNEIVALWFAYIITRPLGASFADWLAVSANQGGPHLGKGTVSVASWILIIAFVAFLAITHRDTRPRSAVIEAGTG